MTVQFIKTPSGDELAVLPRADYEDLVDRDAAKSAHAALVSGQEELLSADEMRALLDALSPLAFWRTKRGIAASDLARLCGIGSEEFQGLEDGSRLAPISVYQRAAEALGITLDDLAAD